MIKIFGMACAIALCACGGAPAKPADPPMPGDPAGGGQSPPAEAGHDDCEHIAKVCHDHAGASAVTKECHEIGHGGDAAKCAARHEECEAACEEAAKTHAGGEGEEHHH